MDYLSAIALFVLPITLDWTSLAKGFLITVAVLTLLYSLFSDFELGLVRMISMRIHLIVDMVFGVLLIGTALVMMREPKTIRLFMFAFGLLEIVISVLSENTPYEKPAPNINMHRYGRRDPIEL